MLLGDFEDKGGRGQRDEERRDALLGFGSLGKGRTSTQRSVCNRSSRDLSQAQGSSRSPPMSSPDVQKAWLVVRQGRPERALKLDINRPVPKRLRPGEVLVRTQAAALNPV